MVAVLSLAGVVVLAGAVAAARLGWAKRAALARFLRVTGFVVMAVSTFFFGAFVIGEAFGDPMHPVPVWTGTWQAAAWLIPALALAALAWYRPGRMVPVGAVLTAVVISIGIVDVVIRGEWLRGRGPIQAILTLALAAAIAVLGLKRTAAAGVLLLLLGIVPVAAELVFGPGPGLGLLVIGGSLGAVSAPVIIAGALYLSSALAAGRPPPAGRADSEPGELPKAA